MVHDETMTEDRLAEEICDDFEVAAVRWQNQEFHHLVGMVVFYEAALRVTRAKPYRQEFVQSKVLAFLEMKLLEVSENLLKVPLSHIRKRITTLENDE